MQIRTFAAPTLTEALGRLRAELGPDAYVLATDQPERGPARVVAALPELPPSGDTSPPPAELQRNGAPATPATPAPGSLAALCRRHGIGTALADQLARAELPGRALEITLPAALGAVFEFAPVQLQRAQRPLLLVGPPGGGKTVTAAKVAAAARVVGRNAHLMTTDTWRAAGAEQLQRYAASLRVGCDVATTDAPLRDLVAGRALRDELLIVDTPGLVPSDAEDRGAAIEWARAIDAQVVLVMPAGLDPEESAEMATGFAALGAERLIATRVDATRRLGGVLAAAHATGLPLAGIGLSPRVLAGYASLDPDLLARCLLSDDRRAATLLDDGFPAPVP
ncbi:MAG: hypothetical protein JNK67_02620 [Alphaproteobacteria bacterium]|nr:hypothetical protein [Alphaproteobacteria bacterium]